MGATYVEMCNVRTIMSIKTYEEYIHPGKETQTNKKLVEEHSSQTDFHQEIR
jgi:hypothetical protein